MHSANDLKGVVRTMKALAASSISQYEQSTIALVDYYRAVELALSVNLRAMSPRSPLLPASPAKTENNSATVSAIVFGTDQGLVGQFNEDIADYAIETLASLGATARVWTVGERVRARLQEAGVTVLKSYPNPSNIGSIANLICQIQIDTDQTGGQEQTHSLYIFHNHAHVSTTYKSSCQRLLPLDQQWSQRFSNIQWPTKMPAEVLGNPKYVLLELIHEYLFISLYRACAESLASENASRLAAMQRAEKNIDELLDTLESQFNSLRQSNIDEELSDVLAGYELLNDSKL